MPPGLRKSGIPDSVLMPAPVNTTTRRELSISRFSAAPPDSSLIPGTLAKLPDPAKRGDRTAATGSAAQRGSGDMPEPYRDQAQHYREHDIAARLQPMALPRQIQRLQAEGGECREAAADPDHDKRAGVERRCHAAIRPGEGGVEPDHERSQHVDQDRAPGKLRSEDLGPPRRQPEPRDAADRAADRDIEIGPPHPLWPQSP